MRSLRLLALVRAADSHDNPMFDAQIAALCREHGIDGILTNDSNFERFGALRVHLREQRRACKSRLINVMNDRLAKPRG